MSERQVGSILAALKSLTGDADAGVRQAAAKCFWVVHATWPTQAEALKAKLDPSQVKLLGRHAPTAAGAAKPKPSAAKPWAKAARKA